MSKIRKSLLNTIFSGFTMWRWNDKLRPTELYEMDKQAHKMIVAFLLVQSLQCEREEKERLLHEVIEGALFDFFYRLVITDIKPPLFYKIKENKEHYKKLTEYVIKELEPIFSSSPDFFLAFQEYHRKEEEETSTRNILLASHLFASQWEFNLIKDLNHFDTEIQAIEKDFKDKLKKLACMKGLKELNNILDKHHPLGAFAHYCGQLRFQVRWTQEPRLPLTSVLGHTFFVATVAYFVSLDIKTCKVRAINNFFCGLFHDLPELLTRDIITPVKNSSENLPDFIKQYEYEELENRILNPLKSSGYTELVDELSYLLGLEIGGEFNACYVKEKNVYSCSSEVLHRFYNQDQYRPKDGEIIKACDILAAFMEAKASMRYGVASQQILSASIRLAQKMPNPLPEHINFKALLADFD